MEETRSLEDYWPELAGQRIWSDDPEGEVPYVYCLLCGAELELSEGQEYAIFSNSREVFLLHGTCGRRLDALRVQVEEESAAADLLHAKKEKADE